MLHQTSFGESQADPFMAHWHRKPRLRDQAEAIAVIAALAVCVSAVLLPAVLAELCQQLWWKASRRRRA